MVTLRSDNLFGNVVRKSSTDELTLVETEYSSYVRLPLHSHPFSYFCFVLGGSFTERFGRQERVCWPDLPRPGRAAC